MAGTGAGPGFAVEKIQVKKAPSKSIWIAGLTRLAAEINGHFKISCAKQNIKNWQRRSPPFPAPKASNRYNRAECFAWVEKFIMPSSGPVNQSELAWVTRAEQAKSEREVDRAERERFELDKEKGLYVLRSAATQTTIGVIKKYHGFVKAELESNSVADRREKLQQLGVSVEIVALFHEFDLKQAQAMVDRIEQKCEKETGE